MDFTSVQQHMRQSGIDAWVMYDFRGSNFVFSTFVPGIVHTTRRLLFVVPARGEAFFIAHHIDAPALSKTPIEKKWYLRWQDLRTTLSAALSGLSRVAMEYSPGCMLPVVSIADAGTVELVRSMGVEVVSSADLIQTGAAVWPAASVARHAEASRHTSEIMRDAFGLIRHRLASGVRVTEHEGAEYIREQFRARGLEYPDGPIVASNAHSGDPHFEPTPGNSVEIRRGDWVLIDLWARMPGNENIHSDITWVGCAGEPSAEQRSVFTAVKAARDAALERAQRAWRQKERVEGWQIDDAAMEQIISRAFGEFIRHRTGHSLSPGAKVHGIGMNIDNLETHDTRQMLPGLGFTIEPGIYTPTFGVRMEINVYVDPAAGPIVTSCVQDDIEKL
ncbi:MAG: M24 family metallopeptidase [Planctomycetota bacterium]|nr:M24 family metallopeptidase [Planctomycetota bacterium]